MTSGVTKRQLDYLRDPKHFKSNNSNSYVHQIKWRIKRNWFDRAHHLAESLALIYHRFKKEQDEFVLVFEEDIDGYRHELILRRRKLGKKVKKLGLGVEEQTKEEI